MTEAVNDNGLRHERVKVHNYYKEVAKDDVNDFCCFAKLNCLSKNINMQSEVLS